MISTFDIRAFLGSYKGRDIIYIPNYGNAGDSLIAYATLQMFDELGLRYRIRGSRVYRDKLIFLGGGGNLVGKYPFCRDFLYCENNKDNNEIVILPHTIREEDWLVSWLGDNVKVICRDKRSYDYVQGIRRTGETYLGHDMALHTKYPASSGAGVLNAFREDDERTDMIIPPDNIDLSAVHGFIGCTADREAITRAAEGLLNQLGQFAEVNTNRLHVAIAGTVLGLRVNLYRNVYWKNEAVYQHSLAGRVNWCG